MSQGDIGDSILARWVALDVAGREDLLLEIQNAIVRSIRVTGAKETPHRDKERVRRTAVAAGKMFEAFAHVILRGGAAPFCDAQGLSIAAMELEKLLGIQAVEDAAELRRLETMQNVTACKNADEHPAQAFADRVRIAAITVERQPGRFETFHKARVEPNRSPLSGGLNGEFWQAPLPGLLGFKVLDDAIEATRVFYSTDPSGVPARAALDALFAQQQILVSAKDDSELDDE